MSQKLIPFQTSFEPGYQQFSQKIAELTKNNKITKSQINLQKLQHQLDLINQQIQDQGLQFCDSPIYTRYATIQQLAQKKKEVPQMCPHCGEQIKKQVQCQICAQVYCKNCCWRKRVIPQSQHKDFRLSCQDCHTKYIRLFSNQKFYKQKQIYLKVIQELAKKYEKSEIKLNTKKQEYKSIQQEKMNFKMKQGTLKKQLMDEQKKYNKVKEEFEQLIKLKAKKMKQREQRKKQQQERRQEQEQKKKQQQKKLKQQEQRKRLQKQKNTHHLQSSEQKRKSQEQEKIRQKIMKELQLKAEKQKQAENAKRQQQMKKQRLKIEQERAAMLLEKQKLQKQKLEIQKIRIQYQSPKKDNTDVQNSPRKQIQNSIILEKQVTQKKQDKIQNNKNQKKDQLLDKKTQQIKTDEQGAKIAQPQKNQSKSQNKTSSTTIDENILLNVGKKNSQQQVSPTRIIEQTLTMNNIKSMNINDLLGMKIPMNPNKVDRSSKTYQQTPINALKSTRQSRQNQSESKEQQQNLKNSILSKHSYKQQESQHSIKSFHDDQPIEQKRMTKDDLLRRSSLISSKKNTILSQPQEPQTTGVDARSSCTCQIM